MQFDNWNVTFTFRYSLLYPVLLTRVQNRTADIVFLFELVKAEVCQLDDPAGVHQAVGGLKVPVYSHWGVVQVRHALGRDTVRTFDETEVRCMYSMT